MNRLNHVGASQLLKFHCHIFQSNDPIEVHDIDLIVKTSIFVLCEPNGK